MIENVHTHAGVFFLNLNLPPQVYFHESALWLTMLRETIHFDHVDLLLLLMYFSTVLNAKRR